MRENPLCKREEFAMPDISGLGALQKTLLAALDQMGSVVGASLTNPDGSPRGDLVFLHVVPGHPVEAKVYRDPLTPSGGGGAAGPAAVPAASSDSARAAARTAALVDPIYQLGQDVAIAGLGRASQAWGLLAGAMRPQLSLEPDAQKSDIDLASNLLWVSGDATKHTPGYQAYLTLQGRVQKARGDYNAAFMKAKGDPDLSDSWGVDGLQYDEAVQEAMTDLAAANQNDSPLTYEDAETFMKTTVGRQRSVAAVEAVKQQWQALGNVAVGGGGEVSVHLHRSGLVVRLDGQQFRCPGSRRPAVQLRRLCDEQPPRLLQQLLHSHAVLGLGRCGPGLRALQRDCGCRHRVQRQRPRGQDLGRPVRTEERQQQQCINHGAVLPRRCCPSMVLRRDIPVGYRLVPQGWRPQFHQ